VLERLSETGTHFLERFAAVPKHGRNRRYLARAKEDLYPGRPDLAQYSHQLKSGWWVGTNYSRASIKKILEMACEVAGLRFGTDLVAELGTDE
jgi:hypothetical protein